MSSKRNTNYFYLSMQKESIGRRTLNHVHVSHPSILYSTKDTMFIEQLKISIKDIDELSKI